MTDSVHAAAELQYAMPCSARSLVSTQSKPAPAEAKTRQLFGSSGLDGDVGECMCGREGNVHQFCIPVAHFAACVPEGAVHGYEVAVLLLLQGALKFISFYRVCSDDVELLCQFVIQVVIPFDVIAEVQDGWLWLRGHCERRYGVLAGVSLCRSPAAVKMRERNTRVRSSSLATIRPENACNERVRILNEQY